MSLQPPDNHPLLEPLMTIVVGAISGIIGALGIAFTSGKRFGEIQRTLDGMVKQIDRMEARLDKHLDKGNENG